MAHGVPIHDADGIEMARRAARLAGIGQVKPSATLGDVGHAIQSVAHRAHFSVVRWLGLALDNCVHAD